MPLTSSGVHDELEPPQYPYSPTVGLFDVLHDLGWREEALLELAIPRKRPGRSIHPGIEAALEQLAACYGVTVRCAGCPTAMDLLRLNLQGPDAWPALVPVLREWDWSPEAIAFITTIAGEHRALAHPRGHATAAAGTPDDRDRPQDAVHPVAAAGPRRHPRVDPLRPGARPRARHPRRRRHRLHRRRADRVPLEAESITG